MRGESLSSPQSKGQDRGARINSVPRMLFWETWHMSSGLEVEQQEQTCSRHLLTQPHLFEHSSFSAPSHPVPFTVTNRVEKMFLSVTCSPAILPRVFVYSTSLPVFLCSLCSSSGSPGRQWPLDLSALCRSAVWL